MHGTSKRASPTKSCRRRSSRAEAFWREGRKMRIVPNIVGVLCSLIGCVWLLQGINVLPGSFMSGQTKWAVYGSLLLVIGVGLVIRANRRHD